MGVKFDVKSETASNVVTGERLWLNAEKDRVVRDGDPDAAYLLAAPGDSIPRADAERYGLVAKEKGTKPAADPAKTANGDEPVDLSKLMKAELVAHAAKLDPPLELDEKSTKDELVAAI